MNDFLSFFLLLSVPGMPLLLAIPALRSRLSWSCYAALLPSIILLTVPVDFSIEIPWMLFGTGLGIDGISRLFLAMSVILWVAASIFLHLRSEQPAGKRLTTFFLLTMAGHLGVILTTELVGFFAFSALMGYGFYGLLVDGGDKTARRAGRIYLGFMILADLALFEVLLIAAVTTDDLSYEAVHQTMAMSPSLGLYLSITLIGFAFKTGVWPLHFWLTQAFRSSRPAVAVLLAGVPVAIGLLGAVRWLPLGEIISPGPGFIVQGVGIAAMIYAILAGLIGLRLKTLPAYVIIFFTGFYAAALGTGLTDPVSWNQHVNLAHFSIVLMVIGLVALVTLIRWLETRNHYSTTHKTQTDDSNLWFDSLPGAIESWNRKKKFENLPRKCVSFLAKAGHFIQLRKWQRMLDLSEYSLQRWAYAITLFLLLGLTFVFLAY